jgi:hypothetical protein
MQQVCQTRKVWLETGLSAAQTQFNHFPTSSSAAELAADSAEIFGGLSGLLDAGRAVTQQL